MYIVDICGTLYDSNTTLDFCEYRLSSRVKKLLLRGSRTVPGKILNKITMKLFGCDFIRSAHIKTLSKTNVSTIEIDAENFVNNFLENKKIKEVHSILSKLNEEHIVLVSATIEPVAKAISRKLGFDNYCATTLSVNNLDYTGSIEKDLLGKKHEVFKDQQVSMVITDNKSDYELCKKADRVVIVSKRKDLSFWKRAYLKIERIIEV